MLSWRTDNIINIIIGEGEFIVPAIVNGYCLELPFIQKDNKKVYKVDKNSIYYPKDISKLALNRKYLPDEIIYNHYGQKEGCIVTSRGCIYNCAFCGGAKSINKDVTTRERNEISIIHEIEEIQSFYPDIQSIRILDDLFIRNISGIDKAYRIFSNFQNIVWRGMIHVLSILNGLDKVKVLKDSKCQELFIGIESGSENIRKRINKAGSTDDIIKVASTILSLGIDLKGYFIYGFPGETEEDYKHTYELAQKIRRISDSTPGNFRTSVFQFRPYHGTELYNEIMKNDGIIHGCEESKELNIIKGRKQFNFNFGNYSNTSDEILEKYIINTQGL